VGALLLWEPRWEGDEAPFATRQWDLCPPDAAGRGASEAAGAVQPGSLFVLDGQQRLTSLFRVIFASRMRGRTVPDPDLLVALSGEPEWVENPFHLRARGLHRRMRDGLLVPAEVLFEGVRGGNESLAVQRALGEWLTAGDERFFEALDRANAIRNAILQAEVVAYEIDAMADDDNVIEIFARLNQQGVRLRPGELAAARLTGHMANFRRRASEVLQLDELRGFSAADGEEQGTRTGAFVDTDLLIRAAMFVGSGGVRYRDVERRAEAPYREVEASWDATVEGFKKAVQLYRRAGVPSGDWLPYRYLLLPPAVAVAKGHALDERWLAWAVLASSWRHYAGEVDTKLQRDAGFAADGDVAALVDHVKRAAKRTDSAVPDEDDFTKQIVGEGGVMLALLVYFARVTARSFPGGKVIAGAHERLEVHRIFPRRALDAYPERDNEYVPDRLGNLTVLTRSDAEQLTDTPPMWYLPEVDPEQRTAHLVPNDSGLWTVDQYREFCAQREHWMATTVQSLLADLGLP
jgi:hypothetical protein